MNRTVVIVDDSLTVRMDLAQAFEAAGFCPRPCANAREARQAFADETIALVVLDVLLPDGDGVELLREIRMNPRTYDLPVLMLSSEAAVKDRIRGLQTGADDYVGKPYDLGYLVARARELVRAQHGAVAQERVTILVIDDSTTSREELRRALERTGYGVITAATGEEGLRSAAAQRPAAIVVDSVMPGIDGATVIRRIRLDAALRGIPCILLTASEDQGGELRALDAGADAFVRKDEDVDVILARLAATLRSAGSERAQAASLAGPKRILAVDDSATYLQTLASMLREDGYDVVLARSGEEALELLSVQTVDCILLDLLMPGLGGKETCRRVKGSSPYRDVPLIMLSALEDRTSMIEGLGAGADDYISKSSDFDILRARVRAQVRRKQFEDENRIRENLLRSELRASESRAARREADIALRKNAEALLLQKVVELNRSNRELAEFAYIASHDLQEPLRMVASYTQLLSRRYKGKLDADADEFIAFAVDGANRMQRLIQDLLTYSRVGTTGKELRDTSSEEALQQALKNLRSAIEEGAVLVTHDPLPAVLADETQLIQLFQNLVGNAIKYHRSGVPEVHISAVRNGKEKWMFAVQDNGLGIDEQYFEKIFGMFQRLHKREEFEGTGIGLAICKKIVERHGGSISVESQMGQGSTFRFALTGIDVKS